jgi:hypothetical protein
MRVLNDCQRWKILSRAYQESHSLVLLLIFCIMTSKKPKETIQPIQPTSVQPPHDLSEGTNGVTQTPPPSESPEKTQPSETQQSTRTKVRYFKNTNITSLSFVSKDGRMHTFIDGVFRTDDPVVIE